MICAVLLAVDPVNVYLCSRIGLMFQANTEGARLMGSPVRTKMSIIFYSATGESSNQIVTITQSNPKRLANGSNGQPLNSPKNLILAYLEPIPELACDIA